MKGSARPVLPDPPVPLREAAAEGARGRSVIEPRSLHGVSKSDVLALAPLGCVVLAALSYGTGHGILGIFIALGSGLALAAISAYYEDGSAATFLAPAALLASLAAAAALWPVLPGLPGRLILLGAVLLASRTIAPLRKARAHLPREWSLPVVPVIAVVGGLIAVGFSEEMGRWGLLLTVPAAFASGTTVEAFFREHLRPTLEGLPWSLPSAASGLAYAAVLFPAADSLGYFLFSLATGALYARAAWERSGTRLRAVPLWFRGSEYGGITLLAGLGWLVL